MCKCSIEYTNFDMETILKLAVLLTNVFLVVQAGICWRTITESRLCRNIESFYSSREECCNTRRPTMAWSNHSNPTTGTIFYWAILQGGAPQCSPCHTSCLNVQCGSKRRCRIRHGKPKCVCVLNCSEDELEGGQVCGSDGVSYRNICTLRRNNCRRNTVTQVAYTGNCRRSCSSVSCSEDLQCLEDQNGLPHCVRCLHRCNTATSSSQAVCGEDNITYPSVCHIIQATCRKGSSIRLAYRGPCVENASCENLQCPSGKICLTNTTTGFPQCALCHNNCNTSLSDVVVCGSDNVTYRSYCSMQQKSCRIGEVIKTKYSGRCFDYVSTVQSVAEDDIDNYFS